MTVHPTWPDHLLDLDEWSALPEDPSRRIELAEGVLFVAPRPIFRHQMLIMRLAGQLDVAARGRWRVFPEVEVVVDAGPAPTVRVPDLVVAPPDLPDEASRCDARRLLAVLEVVSPGTRRLDRILKFHEYADAGVPCYLLVEPGPPVTLTDFRLVGGTYVQVAEHAGRAPLELGATLDLDALDHPAR